MDSEEIQHLEAVVKPKQEVTAPATPPLAPTTSTPLSSGTKPETQEGTKWKPPHPTSSINAPDPILLSTQTTPVLSEESVLQKLRNVAASNPSAKLDSISKQLTKQLAAGLAPDQLTVDDTDGEGKAVLHSPHKLAIGGDEDGDEEDEEELVAKSYPKNLVATANVFQFLINRCA